MPRFSGYVRSITPLTTDDNFALDPNAAGESGVMEEFSWGGEATATTAMHTLIGRSASGTTPVAGDVQKVKENSAGNTMVFIAGPTGWATEPTLDAGALFETSWNAHGGVIRWLAPPGGGFYILGGTVGTDTISCRNTVGTAVSTYGCFWEED